jgi:hypothetical protein
LFTWKKARYSFYHVRIDNRSPEKQMAVTTNPVEPTETEDEINKVKRATNNPGEKLQPDTESLVELPKQEVPQIVISPPADGGHKQQQGPVDAPTRLAPFPHDIATMKEEEPLQQDAMPATRVPVAPELPEIVYGRATVSPKFPSALLSLYRDEETEQDNDDDNDEIASIILNEIPLFIFDPSDESALRSRGVLLGGINGDRYILDQSGSSNHEGQGTQVYDVLGTEGDPDGLPTEIPRAIGSIACFEFLGFDRLKAAQLARKFIANAYLDYLMILKALQSPRAASEGEQWIWQLRRLWRQLELDALDVLDDYEMPDIRGSHRGEGDSRCNTDGENNVTMAGSASEDGDTAPEPEVNLVALEALMDALHLNTESRMVLRQLGEANCMFDNGMSAKDWVHYLVTSAICQLEQMSFKSRGNGIAIELAKARAGLETQLHEQQKMKTRMEEEENALAQVDAHIRAMQAMYAHRSDEGNGVGMQTADCQEKNADGGETSDRDLEQQDLIQTSSQVVERAMQSFLRAMDDLPASDSDRTLQGPPGGSGEKANGSSQEEGLQKLESMHLDSQPDSATQKKHEMTNNHRSSSHDKLSLKAVGGMGRRTDDDKERSHPAPESPPKKRKLDKGKSVCYDK